MSESIDGVSVKISKDKKPGMPFSMIEGMMPMFPILALMGWMIVVISFFSGLLLLSPESETFWGVIKSVRESTDSKYVDANQSIHVLETWIPNLKFFGLGLGLMAIAMALGIIAKKLRIIGKVVSAHMDESVRPPTPEIPGRVKLMQLSAMMGIMILIITMILGFVFAFGAVTDYWGVDIPTLNAYTGDDLADSGFVKSFKHWLGPLRMLGMSFLFISITIALSVIIEALKIQNKNLETFSKNA